MTDRLKEWLDGEGQVGHANWGKALAALRAVVELHTTGNATLGLPPSAQPRCGCCREEWPCSTRRAIEKEVLK
jgi:hypothetical protein